VQVECVMIAVWFNVEANYLCGDSLALASDTSGELDVLGHDGDTLCVDRAQVGVFKQADHVGLGCFLEREHGLRLEAEVRLELLRNFPHQPLEGQLPDEQVRRLLELADFSQCDGAGSEAVRFLDAAGLTHGCRFAGGLARDLLPGRLGAGVLACGLLGTGHSVRSFWFWLLRGRSPFKGFACYAVRSFVVLFTSLPFIYYAI